MSSKFQYAPGMPGYGTKGNNGTDGSTGLSMYFTNLNGDEDGTTITSRITGNIILWTSATSLPENRHYQTGDTFVDKQGKVWKIDLNLTSKYAYTGYYLNAAELFDLYDVPNDIDIIRYSNQYINTYLIIDSIFSKTVTEYTEYPADVYGIKPVNYGRIEFSNIESENRGYHPFTLFTSGIDNNNSIALVRDINTKNFRLGNLDASGKTRDTNLILDFYELTVTKDASNYFNTVTTEGTILTNYEMKINNLLDPVFNNNPSTFRFDATGGAVPEVSIYWDLYDIAGTYDTATIKGDLYLYQNETIKNTTTGFIVANPSSLILRNIDASGVVLITGLTLGKSYHTYIEVIKDGWKRETNRLLIYPGVIPQLDVSVKGIINPSTTIECSSTGTGTAKFNFDVSTNYSTFELSKEDAGYGISWATIVPSNPITGNARPSIAWTTHDASILLSEHTGSSFRSIGIKAQAGTASKTVYFSQPGTTVSHVTITPGGHHQIFNKNGTAQSPVPSDWSVETTSGWTGEMLATGAYDDKSEFTSDNMSGPIGTDTFTLSATTNTDGRVRTAKFNVYLTATPEVSTHVDITQVNT